MKQVSSQEFQRGFSSFQDAALREPLAITKHGKPRLVVMSVEEYESLRRGARRSLHASELSDADVQAIAEAKMPGGFEHLNDELDDEI